MSFLNLSKRLRPAKRAWKIFTTKLHTKLHKLNTSKAIKKPKTRPKTTITKPLPWPATFQSRLRRRQRRSQTTHLLLRCNRRQTRSAPPVCINGIFPEPVSSLQEDRRWPPATVVAKGKGLITEKRPMDLEMGKLPNLHAADAPGTSKEGGEGRDDTTGAAAAGEAADEMWESLGMESPVMRGINERAEEFISRIRAEMQLQEMMARRL